MILKFAAAALLGVMAVVGIGASAAQATTVNVTYDGTVTAWGGTSGVKYGDAVHGSMRFEATPIDDLPGNPDATKFLATGKWTFSSGAYNWSKSSSGYIMSVHNPAGGGTPQLASLFYTLGSPLSDSMHLIFRSFGSATPPLLSLDDLPPDLAAIAALLGPLSSTGDVSYGGAVFNFRITSAQISVSETPIPAALPLFMSALGGLGWMGYRRKALNA